MTVTQAVAAETLAHNRRVLNDSFRPRFKDIKDNIDTKYMKMESLLKLRNEVFCKRTHIEVFGLDAKEQFSKFPNSYKYTLRLYKDLIYEIDQYIRALKKYTN